MTSSKTNVQEILDQKYNKIKDDIKDTNFLDALNVIETIFDNSPRKCSHEDCWGAVWDGTHSALRLKKNIMKQIIAFTEEHDCSDLTDALIRQMENYQEYRINKKVKKLLAQKELEGSK